VLHEFQAHDPVVHIGEERTGEVNHVHFEATLNQAIRKGTDKSIWILGETLTPLRMLGIALVLLGPSFTLRAEAPVSPTESEGRGA